MPLIQAIPAVVSVPRSPIGREAIPANGCAPPQGGASFQRVPEHMPAIAQMLAPCGDAVKQPARDGQSGAVTQVLNCAKPISSPCGRGSVQTITT